MAPKWVLFHIILLQDHCSYNYNRKAHRQLFFRHSNYFQVVVLKQMNNFWVAVLKHNIIDLRIVINHCSKPLFWRHRLPAHMSRNLFFTILIYLQILIILLSNTACTDFAIFLYVTEMLQLFIAQQFEIFLGGLIQELYLRIAFLF